MFIVISKHHYLYYCTGTSTTTYTRSNSSSVCVPPFSAAGGLALVQLDARAILFTSMISIEASFPSPVMFNATSATYNSSMMQLYILGTGFESKLLFSWFAPAQTRVHCYIVQSDIPYPFGSVGLPTLLHKCTGSAVITIHNSIGGGSIIKAILPAGVLLPNSSYRVEMPASVLVTTTPLNGNGNAPHTLQFITPLGTMSSTIPPS